MTDFSTAGTRNRLANLIVNGEDSTKWHPKFEEVAEQIDAVLVAYGNHQYRRGKWMGRQETIQAIHKGINILEAPQEGSDG